MVRISKVNSKAKKTFKIIKNVIYILMVLFLLMFIVMQLLPVDKSLKYFGFRPLIISSGSMKGEIDILDVVVIKRINLEKLKAGDTITFYPPQESIDENSFAYGELFTHYVASVEKVGGGYEIHTKSNISEQWDDWSLTEENLVGEKWFSIPKIGYVILAFQNPIVLRNFVVIVILIIAIIWIWPWRKKDSEKDEEIASNLDENSSAEEDSISANSESSSALNELNKTDNNEK